MNYLINLLAALRDHASGRIEPVLFVENEAQGEGLAPFLDLVHLPPVIVSAGTGQGRRWRKLVDSVLLQRDYGLERVLCDAGVDLVFQHSAWFGLRFGLPTLTWIPDFQHRHLPHMFSRTSYFKRELGYRGLSHSATRLMLSSEDARHDCEQFYVASRGKSEVVRFAVGNGDWADDDALAEIRARHGLPERFFYLPNQFWKHKNHRLVIEALDRLRQRGLDVVVAASGSMQDVRDPGYPASLAELVRTRQLEARFRFLGLVPRSDIPKLMQAALAVVNPSLFEGWSTVVEEAKSLGVELLLSDLRVHREQAPPRTRFFDPYDVSALAEAMALQWTRNNGLVRDHASYLIARAKNELARAEFARQFSAVCKRTLDHWTHSRT